MLYTVENITSGETKEVVWGDSINKVWSDLVHDNVAFNDVIKITNDHGMSKTYSKAATN